MTRSWRRTIHCTAKIGSSTTDSSSLPLLARRWLLLVSTLLRRSCWPSASRSRRTTRWTMKLWASLESWLSCSSLISPSLSLSSTLTSRHRPTCSLKGMRSRHFSWDSYQYSMASMMTSIQPGLLRLEKRWRWHFWSTFSHRMHQNLLYHSWNCSWESSIADAVSKSGKLRTRHKILMSTPRKFCSLILMYYIQESRSRVTSCTRKTSRTCALCSCTRQACRFFTHSQPSSSLCSTGFTRACCLSITARRRSSTRRFPSNLCGGSNSAWSCTL